MSCSTVFVLGAGASEHAGYPLIATMSRELLSWMSGHERFRDTADFIVQAFGSEPNIEDVITELDSRTGARQGSEIRDDKVEWRMCANIKSEIRTAVPLWFREIRDSPALAYAAFAERIVSSGDTIITFNYDDSVERELKRVGKWDISRGYGFDLVGPNRVSQVTVLKLHGSINWLVSLFGGSSGFSMVGPDGSLGSAPRIGTDDLRFLGYSDLAGNFPDGGGWPSVILPGRTKEFYYTTSFGREHEAFFESLWAEAAAALRKADRLVVCGYRMAEADQRACHLLSGIPAKNIDVEIVCGGDGPRITNSFRSAGYEGVVCYADGYFQSWVENYAGHERLIAPASTP